MIKATVRVGGRYVRAEAVSASYVDLFWTDRTDEPFETIGIYEYKTGESDPRRNTRAGIIEIVNEWAAELEQGEIENYWQNTRY